MEFKLERVNFTDTSTIGLLSLNGVFICFILEDKDRGLKDSMTLEEINKIKVFSTTCIPYGKYEIAITKSNRFSALATQQAGHPVEVWLPELLNVKGYAGVRIHPGNKPEDTEGCLLPGKAKAVDLKSVSDSRGAFGLVFPKIQEAINKKEKVFINIVKG